MKNTLRFFKNIFLFFCLIFKRIYHFLFPPDNALKSKSIKITLPNGQKKIITVYELTPDTFDRYLHTLISLSDNQVAQKEPSNFKDFLIPQNNEEIKRHNKELWQVMTRDKDVEWVDNVSYDVLEKIEQMFEDAGLNPKMEELKKKLALIGELLIAERGLQEMDQARAENPQEPMMSSDLSQENTEKP